jgi:hypothetical protein
VHGREPVWVSGRVERADFYESLALNETAIAPDTGDRVHRAAQHCEMTRHVLACVAMVFVFRFALERK